LQLIFNLSLIFHSTLRKLYTKPSIGASYQITVHLVTRFQRNFQTSDPEPKTPTNEKGCFHGVFFMWSIYFSPNFVFIFFLFLINFPLFNMRIDLIINSDLLYIEVSFKAGMLYILSQDNLNRKQNWTISTCTRFRCQTRSRMAWRGLTPCTDFCIYIFLVPYQFSFI
jgi:hypothetical protein